MAKENVFHLARMILYDQCPPDNRMYYCNMGGRARMRLYYVLG